MANSTKSPIPGCGTPIEITSVSEWNTILRHAYAYNQTVIADFHAQWCGPCKAIAPTYANLAAQQPFTYFLRVDVDAQKSIAKKYNISAMPTFIVIKRTPGGDEKGKGEVVETLKGADPHGLATITNTHASRAYAPSTTLSSREAEKAKDLGNELFKKRQYAPAVEAYSKAIELYPDSAVLYANRALAYYKWIHSNREGADTIDGRMDLRRKLVADGNKITTMEERWGKGWVRMAEAMLETLSEEFLQGYETEDARVEGKKLALEAVESALLNAIDLSEGKSKLEAQTMLEKFKKEYAIP
ncbi:thioredoxin-like protein [Gymnopus androsaceus JB14]|uniref:Thioredoxin-like protein n=1 Tax=Gymnopus androsaceus JB14 TaxID=1447944 RepID=A0A6A4I7A1_9AGAR|nr:thioredoxin-like protein [Gymnopus androsaceus JB14]